MYYIVYGFLFLLSLLPLRILYIFSDAVYFLVYYVISYRKKTVMYNLSLAFPDKTKKEKLKIAKQFYRNFTDTFIETIKLLSAEEEMLKKHFTGDMSIFFELYEQRKKCQVHLGHNFNWEIANLAMPLYTPYTMLAVYMPMRNKKIDRLFKKLRSRTGAILLPATEMSKAMAHYNNKQYLLALAADQNPGVPAKGYWINFFGRPTPFVKGPEKGARTNNAAVVFAHFTKKKRGYYQVHFELATAEPTLLSETELTKKYIQYLERVISDNPGMWLWSHRRWKHEWKPEYEEIIE